MKIFKTLKFLFIIFFFHNYLIAKNIIIENNNRLSFDDINNLTTYDLTSNTLNENDLNLILKDLISSDLISNVDLSIKSTSFNFKIIESIFIDQIYINGNIKLKNLDILENISIKNKSFIDDTNISYNSKIIENLYSSIGQQDVIVSYYLEKFDNNSYNLIYEIKEDAEKYLTNISLHGNNYLSSKFIKSIITLKEKKFFTPLSMSNFINETKIRNNLLKISNLYTSNGFIDFAINYEIKNFKNKLFLKLYFNEGERYLVKNINLISDKKAVINILNNNIEKINNRILGKYYNANQINIISDGFNKELLLTNNPNFNINHSYELTENKELNITFFATEERPQTINRINFYGNNVTNDDTLRRQIFIKPGELLNKRIINKSVNNLIRKPYIDNATTVSTLNSKDSIDLDFILTEKIKSGNFKIGASYSAQGGAASAIGLSDSNFYGTGNKVSGDLSISSDSLFYDLSLNKYYLGKYSIDNTYRLYNEDEDLIKTYGYKRKSTGVDFAIKIPLEYDISKDEYLNFAIGYENSENYGLTSAASSSVTQNIGSSNNFYFKNSYVNNSRNDNFNPTSGKFHQIILELSPTGLSDDDFIKISAFNNFHFNRIGTDNSFFVLSKLGLASGLSKKIKTKDSFSLGSEFKGFQYSGIGPRDESLNYLGGTKMYQLTFGYATPFLFDNSDTFILRYFGTIGSIFDSEYTSKYNSSSPRASVGVSMDIMTPIGPLSFSLASPISKNNKDKLQTYDFSIGSTF
tara:strand:- start:1414 stop:3666 length:2253 start_codon:yes stop_codon:yes gene_type:complete